MKDRLTNKISRSLGKTKFKIKKHSPEILVLAGVAGTVASAVMACKATLKVNEITEEAKENIEKIHVAYEKGVTEAGQDYSEEDCQKDLAIAYVQTGVKLAKLYGPSLVIGSLSIGAILTGHNITRKRNIALAAAYTAVDNSFKDYRSRVVERFGEKIDKELKYNIKAKEIEETIIDEDGNEKTVTNTIDVTGLDPDKYSQYARFFDDGNLGWTKDPEANLLFLRSQQRYANDKLKAQGYLYLNEVYEMLGIPKTKAGQVVGWIYNPDNPVGDNYVDFGIYDTYKEGCRNFVNGYERTILLDFNVDGNIWELMWITGLNSYGSGNPYQDILDYYHLFNIWWWSFYIFFKGGLEKWKENWILKK